MAYTAPLGDAVDFSAGAAGTYAAPLGDAVDFPAPNDFAPPIPFVRGHASGKVPLTGLASGMHSHPSWVRTGIAVGRIKVLGVAVGAHGVAGVMSGRVAPHAPHAPAAAGARVVPHLNAKTGVLEMISTLPVCRHHSKVGGAP